MKRFFYVLFLLFISLLSFSQATFTPNFTIPSPLCSGIALTTTCAVTPGTTAIVGYTWTSTPAGPVIGSPNASVTSINFATAGTFTISVTATAGGTNTASVSQVVTVNPTPTITATPNPATICVGNSSTLTAAGGTSYTWSPSSSLSSANGSPVTANPSSTTNYTVVGETGGCFSTAVVNLVVNPAMSLLVTASPSFTTCPGGSSTLTATGAGAAGVYTWSPGTGLSSTTGSAVVSSPTVNTAYTIIGLDPLTGCTGTANVSMVIGSPLSVSVSPLTATTCIGGTGVTLSAFGASNYVWSPSASLSSGFGPVVVATPSTSTTYTVLGSTGTCTGQAVVTISVTTPPTLTVTPTNTTICLGSSYTYTATGAGTGGTYTWTPSFTLNNFTGSTVTASPTITTTYTVTGQTALGCLSLPRVVTLTVVPVPTATVSLLTNTNAIVTNTICGNQTATLSVATSTPPPGMAYSYTWSPTFHIVTSSNSASVLAIPAMSVCTQNYLTTYSCTVSYATLQGCRSLVDTVTMSVINCFPPVANFTTAVANDTICTKGCVSFINTSCGGEPQIVKWYSPGGNPDTTSTPFPTICYNVPGDYTVSLAVTNPYGYDSIVKTKIIHVVDTPNTQGLRDTCIRFGQSVQLYGIQALYYKWYPNDGSLTCPDGSPGSCDPLLIYNPIASPTITTKYVVTGYNSKNCKYNDTLTVCVLDDCGEMFVPNAFSPNGDGVNDVLYVRGKCLANFTFQIFNRWGEKVFESSNKDLGWDGTFNSEPLNTGVFVYRLQGTTVNNAPFNLKGNVTLIR